MAHRVVSDTSGGTWQVWPVRPAARTAVRTAPLAAAFAPEYRDGWLAFERMADGADAVGADPRPEADPPGAAPGAPAKRRHAPIPPDWESATDSDVLAWLARVVPVVRRPSRPEVPPPSPVGPPAPSGPPPALA